MTILDELLKQSQISSKRQIRGRLITQLSMMLDGFEDEYSASNILHFLLRKMGDKEDPYDWSDEKLLKRMEITYSKMVKEAQEDKYNK